MNNELIYLNLFEWKRNGVFQLVLNLDLLKAGLVNAGLTSPEATIKPEDVITVSVYLPVDVLHQKVSIGGVDDTGTPLLNLADRNQNIGFSNMNNAAPGIYQVKTVLVRGTKTYEFENKLVVPEQICTPSVELKVSEFELTTSVDLWKGIKSIHKDFFTNMKKFVDDVLCKPATNSYNFDGGSSKSRLPFVNVDEYSLIKYAIDAYLKKSLALRDSVGSYSLNPLPYYHTLQNSLFKMLDDQYPIDCEALTKSRSGFLAIELIWSYWTEQAMLVQAMGAVSLRYQNILGQHEIEPMMRFDTSPLHPLSNLLWGFIQDEQHRTSLRRRTFEYQHAYSLTLKGKAVPRQIGVDNRSPFLAAFHNLLHQASLFYKEYDDKTRNPDAFPLLISLRDVHLLLAEGNHNAYYNMTYTTRHEMLTMQYLLSQPEMQVFLGGRIMMPYEPHVGALDTIKTVQGWDPVGTTHYYELANTGEQLLLSMRYGDWNNSMLTSEDAGNWAVAFRNLVSIYINAYRNVTMVDLSADSSRLSVEEQALQPALLIQRRMSLNAPNRVSMRPKPAPASY